MEKVKVREKPWVRIEIDLNSRNNKGYVRARLSRASGRIDVNEIVTVFEPDDQVAARARVVRLDMPNDFVYLDVDWASLRDDFKAVELAGNPARSGLWNFRSVLPIKWSPAKKAILPRLAGTAKTKAATTVRVSGFKVASTGGRSIRASVRGSVSSSSGSTRIREVVVQ